MTTRKKILYFVTEDWYFCSHRLVLAKAALREGFEVGVLTRVAQHGDAIRDAGILLLPLNIKRGGVNPLYEINTLWQVWKAYRQYRPDIVHHVAVKPVLYGTLVALLFPSLRVVNLMAGLGAIFSSERKKAVLLRPLIKGVFHFLFRRKNTLVTVQNHEDFDLLSRQLGIPTSKLKLVKGSGVDIRRFQATEEPDGIVNIALVSRLLWDKGGGEYVAAVKHLKQKGLLFNAFLVGKPDPENMASIDAGQIQQWNAEGYVQCVGHIDDIAEFWRKMHVAVLPSYREGLPKSLLEAAACGRALITTNTSGCKEIVDDGVNGILVPVKEVTELAEAMEFLILNKALRQKMGAAARHKVEQAFSDRIIVAQTLDIYQEML